MQLLLDYLRFSASSPTAIGKICFMSDDASAVTVHKFVSEQLNLTKELVLNAKVSSGIHLNNEAGYLTYVLTEISV